MNVVPAASEAAPGTVTFLVIATELVSSSAILTTEYSAVVPSVPSPITNDAVPFGWTVSPSPAQVSPVHFTEGPPPDGFTSESVTTVPVGSSTPDSARNALSASMVSVTDSAFRPGRRP